MRTLQRIFLFVAFAAVSQATISGNMQWDVRTTGNDANGGAFKLGATGTDFSQQNSPQLVYSDLLVGATTTEVTSVLNPFSDATSVGNLINIISGTGCTTGRFEVLSVAGGIATLDRSAGTAASVCAANLGGSMATPGAAGAAMVASNAMFIRAATYTVTTSIVTPGNNHYFEGYQNAHHDLGTKPLITTATDSTQIWKAANANGGAGTIMFNNISFSSTAAVRSQGLYYWNALASVIVANCIFDGFVMAIDASNDASYNLIGSLSVTNTEFKNGTQAIHIEYGATNLTGQVNCHACYIHNMSSTGGAIQSTGISGAILTLDFSVMSANVVAISGFTVVNLFNSDIVSNSGTNVIQNAREVANCQNSIFYGNTNTALNVSTVLAVAPACGNGRNNAFGANGTKYNVGTTSIGEITLTANPFTSSTDFTLNSTAGGGALLKAAGFQASITGSTTTGTLDVGAIQGLAAGPPVQVGSAFVQ